MTQSSSVMFSLQELARMEEERVRALTDAAQRERAVRERAEREADARERSERAARELAEEQARAEVERRAREEAARIEAIHRGTVEAARLEADAKARAEARELDRRHELEVERARAASSAARIRGVALSALFGAVVAGGVAVAVHFGVVVPHERERATEASGAMASRDVVLADVRARAEASDARVHGLEDEVTALRGDNERLRAEVEAAHRPTTAHPVPGHGVALPPRITTPTLNGFTTCPPGSKDPMCLQ